MKINYTGLLLFIITSVFLSGILSIIFESIPAIHMLIMFGWGYFVGPMYILKPELDEKKEEQE